MTYRTPYMFAGYRADFNEEFLTAIEERRLSEEATARFVVEMDQDYE